MRFSSSRVVPMGGPKPKSWRVGDGRWLTASIVVAYFCALNLMALVLGCNFTQMWNIAGVAALPLRFEDLHDIANGINRFVNSNDPWSSETIAYSVRAFSYPKWWLAFAFLGLNPDTAYFFGFVFALLYLACAWIVLGQVGLGEGVCAGLLLVSPAVMTGIERGNGDLAIFALLTLAIYRRQSLPWATSSLFLAALLKLYPAAALVAVAAPPWRKTLPWIAVALVLFGLDVATSTREVSQIARGILHMQYFSFGTTPVLIGLIFLYPAKFGYTDILIMGSVLYVAVLAVSIWLRPSIRFKPQWEREIFAFRIGALVYVGTYALGTNYDYRFTMMVFCLPLLFVLIRERGIGGVWAGVATTAIVVYSNWYDVFPDTYGTGLQFFVKQLLGWTILGSLGAILAGTFLGAPAVASTEPAPARLP